MRGNPVVGPNDVMGMGSIPAHAGEPYRLVVDILQKGVYPRPCGGTGHQLGYSGVFGGLSPPMRGNRMP